MVSGILFTYDSTAEGYYNMHATCTGTPERKRGRAFAEYTRLVEMHTLALLVLEAPVGLITPFQRWRAEEGRRQRQEGYVRLECAELMTHT